MTDTDYGTFPVPAGTNQERKAPMPKHPTIATYLPHLAREAAAENGITVEMAALAMIEHLRRECCPRVRLTMPVDDDPRLGATVR